MPAAVAIPDILRFVAACAVSHPAILNVPDYVSMPFEVVSHAQTESHLLPLSVGVNADPARGLLHESHVFPTLAEAVTFTAQAVASGRSVDVGMMGVNLRAHPDAFSSLAEAFDPQANICQGAIILGEAYREVREARCIYNSGRADCRSPTGTNGYPERVAAIAAELRDGIGDARGHLPSDPAVVPAAPQQSACAPSWDAWALASCSATPSVPEPSTLRGIASASVHLSERKIANAE